jgi:hypothetical protein
LMFSALEIIQILLIIGPVKKILTISLVLWAA